MRLLLKNLSTPSLSERQGKKMRLLLKNLSTPSLSERQGKKMRLLLKNLNTPSLSELREIRPLQALAFLTIQFKS